MAKRGKFTDDGYIELYNDDGTSQLIGANSSGANTKTILPATSGTIPASGLPAVGSNGEVLTVVSGAWASAAAPVPQTAGGTYTAPTGGSPTRAGFNLATVTTELNNAALEETAVALRNFAAIIIDLKNLGIIP